MKKSPYKPKKTLTILLSSCLMFGSILIGGVGPVSGADKVNEEEAASYVFVLKENSQFQEMVTDLKERFAELTIDHISEINTLTIAGQNQDAVQEATEYLKTTYQKSIEEFSKEQRVTLEEFKLPDLQTINQNFKQQAFSKSLQAEVQNTEEDRPNIYDPWRWDINKVTSNGESYAIEEGNHQVKIAVVDSGIDFNHPDLKENIIGPGKSFIPEESSTHDEIGHGTMVAGTIAANGKIKGIAPKIGIVPYKVFKGYSADSSWIIKAIIEAADDDMDVINLSLGTYKSLKKEEDRAIYTSYLRAVAYANKQGSLLVASSGTDGYDISNPNLLAQQMGLEDDLQVHMPGGLPNVITVAATTLDNQLAYYSNYGSKVDMSAPAGDYGPHFLDKQQVDLEYMTITTYPTTLPQSELSKYLGFEQGYEFMIGTSLAAPKVSATAALLIVEYQEKHGRKPSPNTIKSYLYRGVTDGKGKRNGSGVGIVNAKGSLDLVNR